MYPVETSALIPILKMAGVFVLVLVLLRLSLQIGIALGVAAAVMGIAFSMSPMDILGAACRSMIDERTLVLVSVVTLILILSSSMERLGVMEELLGRFRIWASGSRWGMVTLPALIGLLPMPGGAYFSAPMLDAFDPEGRLDGALKSFLNYWYRHVWEYWWPLYPGVLLTCHIAGLELWRYILVSIPMTALAVLGGLPHLLRVPRAVWADGSGEAKVQARSAWRPLAPILLAIVPGVGFGLLLQLLGQTPMQTYLPRETGLLGGLVAGVVWAWWEKKVKPEDLRAILLDGKLPRMWMILAGVFAFKGVIEEGGAAQAVGVALLRAEVPLFWVAVSLPMIVGAISGLTIAFVGACFPILVTLVQAVGGSQIELPLMVLAFVSGFTGTLMTPLHLCLILSNEYFRAGWTAVYRRLWLPGVILLGGGMGYFSLIRAIVS